MHSIVNRLPKDASYNENDKIICESLEECAMQPQRDGATEIFSPKNKGITSGMVTIKDDFSGMILETFIVGRKFSDEKELNLGASISLERDPTNVKDSNAIKVHFFCHFPSYINAGNI